MLRIGLIVLMLSALPASASRTDPKASATKASRPVASTIASDAVASLRADLGQLIKSPGDWSVTVVSLDRGDTLFSHASDLPLAPASNMKLFTSAAALYYLGSQYRYNTFLLADGVIENGVLNGNLIIYGTGDPTISDRFRQKMAVWNAFADTLASLGVREIRGNIVADASYFGGSGAGAGWQEDYMNASYAASASALSFAENIAILQIKPAAEAGSPAEVKLIPGGEGIGIVNQATTVAGRRSLIHAYRTSYDGPITVRGQIGRSSLGVLKTVPVSDPPRWAAAVLRETLQKRGIPVSGEISAVQAPGESPVTGRMIFAPAFSEKPPVRVLAIHESTVMFDILEVVNKKSHNLLAEQTLRTVGRVAFGEGTVEAGARAVHHLLEAETGSVTPDLKIYDGSGLSVLDRATTRSIVHLLSFMAKSPMFQDYFQTLPEAGAADGLHRMYRTAAVGNLRAKTGTIDNVSALSGYVRAANGERLAFSIISNSVPSTYRAKRIEDAIGARLANFDRASEGASESSPTTSTTMPAQTSAAPTVTPTPAPAPRPAPAAVERPGTSTISYTIRSGDTFDAIARKNGTTVKALQAANPGVNPRRLIPGKKIKVR
jgi:serine-type D-Ala-D-Ala carboxypeptidase/endopeptidase (penicillin-binding protein 4)